MSRVGHKIRPCGVDVPVIALTATFPVIMEVHFEKALGMTSKKVIRQAVS